MEQIPDRWLEYMPIGDYITHTPFIAFKTPLSDDICSELPPEHKFTPSRLMKIVPQLSLVIDLNTTSKYNKQEFLSNGIDYAKIRCPAARTPSDDMTQKFFDVVDKFKRTRGTAGRLIGVHCMYGINRTGFMICKYLIIRHGLDPAQALAWFNDARGHCLDRVNYIAELYRTMPKKTLRHVRNFVPVVMIYETGHKTPELKVELKSKGERKVKKSRAVKKKKSSVKAGGENKRCLRSTVSR